MSLNLVRDSVVASLAEIMPLAEFEVVEGRSFAFAAAARNLVSLLMHQMLFSLGLTDRPLNRPSERRNVNAQPGSMFKYGSVRKISAIRIPPYSSSRVSHI